MLHILDQAHVEGKGLVLCVKQMNSDPVRIGDIWRDDAGHVWTITGMDADDGDGDLSLCVSGQGFVSGRTLTKSA